MAFVHRQCSVSYNNSNAYGLITLYIIAVIVDPSVGLCTYARTCNECTYVATYLDCTGGVNNQPVAYSDTDSVNRTLWPFSATEFLVAIFSVLKYIGKIPTNIGTIICNI